MAIKFSELFGSGQDAFNNEKLEELFSKTKDVAETVSKKSAERIELSKKRVECLDTKAKLAKLYEKYGRLQYGVKIGDEIGAEVLSDYENQIASMRQKIERLTREIEETKATFSEPSKHMSYSKESEEVAAEAVEIIPADNSQTTE